MNTPLYYDFQDLQQDVRCVLFRLLGDVTAFVDDIAEIDGSNLRNLPLATGLSLSNKIKLYYYADTYEMGKIGSLSAVWYIDMWGNGLWLSRLHSLSLHR